MNHIQEQFYRVDPSLNNYWRSIILFGNNTATYKFALASTLLELKHSQTDWISLEDLAVPYSHKICERMKLCNKQSTAKKGPFLSACEMYNENNINRSDLKEKTIQHGFKYVLDAFHNVGGKTLDRLFFIDERKINKGIRLTDNFFNLTTNYPLHELENETQARWGLVEFAWSQKISSSIIEYDNNLNLLFNHTNSRRINLASCRDALNGYQKGKCFYCFDRISVDETSPFFTDIDHFFPHSIRNTLQFTNVNGIWNLVLACKNCNRGSNGKFGHLPDLSYLTRLNKRNEYLITSHHPLKETLKKQTGNTTELRRQFLQQCYNQSKIQLIHEWIVPPKGDAAF